jgi:2-oxoglutarate dehydrogenase E2 component (dihydrolipoamide succinyltransferase)
MAVELRVPEVGESISQVEIGDWLKHEGDFVARDDEAVVIETDKATVEIPAPESGILTKILKASGETASVREVIAYIDTDREKPAKNAAPEQDNITADEASQNSRQEGEKVESSFPSAQTVDDDRKLSEAAVKKPRNGTAQTGDKPDGPVTIRSAEELENPMDHAPRGPDQVSSPPTAADADRPGRRQQKVPRPVVAQPVEAAGGAADEPPVRREAELRREHESQQAAEQIVAMSHLRRRIAERLVQAQHSAALLTTFNEIDMSSVIELREKHRDAFNEKHHTKLGFMSFFVKSAVHALRLVPEVNAEIRGDNIVYRNFFDIGVAVGGGKGLVVPVLRHAEHLSFAEIERAISDFARRAEQNELRPEELQGGTFTISNGGVYGSLLSTPIVNPPQSAILGLHAIQERAVARHGAVIIRPMMYVALSYDHRIIDGREAVMFLKHVKNLIEDPTRMLLEI